MRFMLGVRSQVLGVFVWYFKWGDTVKVASIAWVLVSQGFSLNVLLSEMQEPRCLFLEPLAPERPVL